MEQFLNMAKARNITLRPYVLNGKPSLVADGPEMDPAFRHEFERFRHTAAALLWEQAKKTTREFRAAVAAQGGEVKMVYRDGRPLILLAGGIDEQLAEHFEKHHYEINAVILAEGEPSGQVVKAGELAQNQQPRKASNLTLAEAS